MTASRDRTPTVVLVPGAFAGAWMWQDVATQLEDAGIRTRLVEHATYGERAQDKTFADDVAGVREVLDAESSIVLVAHSYGGSVITAAAAGPLPAVTELIYVCAAAPGSGGSMAAVSAAAATAAGQGDGPGPEPRADGLLVFPPEIARQALFNDCSEARAEEGLEGLGPQNMTTADQVIPTAAWTQLPSIYVRGTEDQIPRALAPEFLEHCVEVIDLPTGHCPQWSQPDQVSDIIATRVRMNGSR